VDGAVNAQTGMHRLPEFTVKPRWGQGFRGECSEGDGYYERARTVLVLSGVQGLLPGLAEQVGEETPCGCRRAAMQRLIRVHSGGG
jgi:hypothetical protein